MKTMHVIGNMIATAIGEKRGDCALLSCKYIIKESLIKLCPTVPEDGSFNRIAYNVPNKDRMKLKTGRFLTRKLNINRILKDGDVQLLADKINNSLFPDHYLTTTISTGKDITQNYRESIGGASCMTGDKNYMLMYENNPDIYRQLVMRSNGDSARAILIKLDNGSILMDRVYSTCSFLTEKMFAYAIEKQFLYRQSTSADDASIAFPAEVSYDNLVVSNVKYEDGEVPYQDSLRYYQETGTNVIRLLHERQTEHSQDGMLDSTEGILGNGRCCDNCGCGVDFDDVVGENGNEYCSDCFNELFFYCEHCQETCPSADENYVKSVEYSVCDDCLSQNFQWCENCNEHFEDTVEENGEHYCQDCHDELFAYCEHCGCFELIENMQNIDSIDDPICDDCLDDYTECAECGDMTKEAEEVDGKFYCEDCKQEVEA